VGTIKSMQEEEWFL